MIKVDAIGFNCPVPVVKALEAIKTLNGPGQVEVLVDNEIAVQNLIKMSTQKGYESKSNEISKQKYSVIITVGTPSKTPVEEQVVCVPCGGQHKIVVISSDKMGSGNDELGAVLMKGFIYAVSKLEELPKAVLFYNGGATLTCEGSDSLEDIKALDSAGVEIITCGTCLDYYGLTSKLAIGSVTNMYSIVETMNMADVIIKP